MSKFRNDNPHLLAFGLRPPALKALVLEKHPNAVCKLDEKRSTRNSQT